jgi:hypothetical protein
LKSRRNRSDRLVPQASQRLRRPQKLQEFLKPQELPLVVLNYGRPQSINSLGKLRLRLGGIRTLKHYHPSKCAFLLDFEN